MRGRALRVRALARAAPRAAARAFTALRNAQQGPVRADARAPAARSCNDCFERHAAAFANGELRLIEARKGLLYCPMRTEAGDGCAAPAFTLKQLQSRSATALESYIAMREKLTEKAAIDTAHATAARQAAFDAGRSPVERGIDFVRGMLNEKCPGCLQACPGCASFGLWEGGPTSHSL